MKDLNEKQEFDKLRNFWLAAYDLISEVESAKNKVKTRKYAAGYAYDLTDYTTKKFPARKRLYTESTDLHSWCFGLDEKKFPVFYEHTHPSGSTMWQGFFRYFDNRAEFISFCVNSAIPDKVEFVEWENGVKKKQYSLIVNGSGSLPPGIKPPSAQQILSDPHYLLWSVEEFLYKDGVVNESIIFGSYPGISDFRNEKTYNYREGKLQETWVQGNHGNKWLEYSRPVPGENLRSIAEKLENLLYQEITSFINNENIDSPLQFLSLSYATGNTIIPTLIYVTENELTGYIKSERYDPAAVFGFLLWIEGHRMYDMDNHRFEPYATQLFRILQRKSNWKEVNKLLYAVANRINHEFKSDKISKDFFAYAIDAEFDANNEASVFRKNGATREMISEWKKLGWFN